LKDALAVSYAGMMATVLLNLWFIVPFLHYNLRYSWGLQASRDWFVFKFVESAIYLPQYFMTSSDGALRYNNFLSSGVVGEMSFSLGLTTLIILICSFLFKRSENYQEKWQEVFCVALIGLVMFTASTSLPWEKILRVIPQLDFIAGNIQFLWRLNMISVILVAWLFCLVANKLGNAVKRWFIVGLVIVGVLQAVDFSSKVLAARSPLFISEMSGGCFHQLAGEYLPVGVDVSDLQERLTVGEALQVEEWSREYNSITVSVSNDSGHSDYLEVPLLNYPGYRAIDTSSGTPLNISNGVSSRIMVEIPASYSGTFVVAFHSPWYWRAAELVSLVFMVFLVLAYHPLFPSIRLLSRRRA
jgi:hypothetical protein